MKVVILAGGMGSRLQEETESKPKPMVEIGGRPILWHIMNIYSAGGYNNFVVALGYKGEIIKRYFLDYYYLSNNFEISTRKGDVSVHEVKGEDWTVNLIDTGFHTETGGRIKKLKSQIGNETFMMTYGDGVADVNLKDLIATHKKHGKLATVTAVRPPARFGGLKFNGDMVSEFLEKPQIGEGWINGGFFVLEPGVLDYIKGDETIFEKEPLERLVEDKQLVAYRHEGFWQCMDTLRDVRLLEKLYTSGHAPWLKK